MNVDDWNRQRARFNHDWLQNRFMIYLMARANHIDAYKPGDAMFIGGMLEWSSQKTVVDELMQSAEETFSPKTILRDLFREGFASDEKEKLFLLAHELYLHRTGIAQKVALVRQYANEANSIVNELLVKGGKEGSSKQLMDLCKKLSASISDLPHGICDR